MMKDISLGWPGFEPPSSRCYTDWYIPLCSAQSLWFIANSLFFHMCVCVAKRNMVSHFFFFFVLSSVECVAMPFFLVRASWEGDSALKKLLCSNVSQNRSHPKNVTLEWCELNWSVCVCEWIKKINFLVPVSSRFKLGESAQLGVWIPPASYCDPPFLCGWTQHLAVLRPISKNKVKGTKRNVCCCFRLWWVFLIPSSCFQ